MNPTQLAERNAMRLNKVEQTANKAAETVNGIAESYPRVLKILNSLLEVHDDIVPALARTEQHCFVLIKLGMDKGLWTFPEVLDGIEALGKAATIEEFLGIEFPPTDDAGVAPAQPEPGLVAPEAGEAASTHVGDKNVKTAPETPQQGAPEAVPSITI